MPSDSEAPTLTPAMVANDDLLWAALNDATLATPGYWKQRRQIIKAQKRLQAMVSPEAWQLCLAIEELRNSRNEGVLTALVRWAYDQGQRHAFLRR